MTLIATPPSPSLAHSAIPVLETERLFLRSPRLEDVPAIAALATKSGLPPMTPDLPPSCSADEARAFVDALEARADGVTFGVHLKQDGAPVFAGLGSFRTSPGSPAPEIGYWIAQPFWGRGIATEAVRAVIDYVFSETDSGCVLGAARVVNPASRRVLEKCAFQWCGVGLCRVRALSASVPVDRFQLERRTWASLRAWGSTALPHRRTRSH